MIIIVEIASKIKIIHTPDTQLRISLLHMYMRVLVGFVVGKF